MFNNDDLKRLRERAIHHNFTLNSLMSREQFESLLARLEAAEALHIYVDHKANCHLRKETGSYCDCNLPVFQNRWRKAAVK